MQQQKNGVFYVIRAATIAIHGRGKHTSTTEGLYFLRGSCRGGILKTICSKVELWDIRRTVTT
jgi:hypothetical protein